jgi:SAM-dependent methyltransferase
VDFLQADVIALPFDPESFDLGFVCFILEHLPRPSDALVRLKALLKPGGTITVIDGDHGSAYFHPESAAAQVAIDCLVELQRRNGGNPMIGRELYPLLSTAGFDAVRVSPRMVYIDSSRPRLVDGFTRKTFTAMVEGVRESAITAASPMVKRSMQEFVRCTERRRRMVSFAIRSSRPSERRRNAAHDSPRTACHEDPVSRPPCEVQPR